MKRAWKGLRTNPVVIALLTWLMALLIRSLFRSLRMSYVGWEVPDRLIRAEGRRVMGAFWHGRLLMMPFAYPEVPWAIMVSRHADGELISRVAERFGIRSVRGSARRGGAWALLGMVRASRRGCHLAITPDGPLGPREEVKTGTIELARLAGTPIIPVAFAASHGKFERSWDRLLVPYPFGRGVFVYGEPVVVPPTAGPEEMEKARTVLEEGLRQVTAVADAYFKKPAVRHRASAVGTRSERNP
ncbi:MAG: lysophospholipid acyltransferase family protein [candidate division NC10 bacterium]|nr:lysophospholipid acyltransferase family protein [candidate division NC10 bacterium]